MQFSINEHVYNSKILLIAHKKLLLKFISILNCWSNSPDNFILI